MSAVTGLGKDLSAPPRREPGDPRDPKFSVDDPPDGPVRDPVKPPPDPSDRSYRDPDSPDSDPPRCAPGPD